MTFKELRKSRGYKTQQALADKIGCSRTYMGYIETQFYFPSQKVLKKLSVALKCDIGKLYKIILYGDSKIKE